MNYYVDSESFKQLWVFIWIDDAGNKGCLFTGSDLKDWFAKLTKEDHVWTKNGLGYDWPMFLRAMKYEGEQEDFAPFMRDINDEIIIEGLHRMSAAKMIEKLKKRFPFEHTDTQEINNMFANLKRAAGAMGFEEVRESAISFNYKGEFTKDMINEVCEYGWADCRATRFLANTKETKTEMMGRDIISNMYDVDVTGLGRPRLMTKIISTLFERQVGLPIWQIKSDLWDKPVKYHFGKILKEMGKDSRISFATPELKGFAKVLLNYSRYMEKGSLHHSKVKKAHRDENGNLRSYAKQAEMLEGHKFDLIVSINGSQYRFKEGGIHSEHDYRPHYQSDDRMQLYDVDFTAFYPGLLMRFDIFPKWMMEAGFDIKGLYSDVYHANLNEKAKPNGNKDLRYAYKIICNLFYGKYGEWTDPLGDGRLQLKTCLTGQLVLLRMIEKLEALGIPCVYANTDGIVVACPRGQKTTLEKELAGMAKVLNIGIDPVEINAMFLDNCNSYLWEMGDGKVKTKKEYSNNIAIRNPTLKFPIVPTAVEKYLVEGIPVETTIKECTDLFQFLEIKSASSAAQNVLYRGEELKSDRASVAALCSKIKGEDKFERGGQLEVLLEKSELPFEMIQRNLRYYHSTGGDTLYKIAHSGKLTGRVSTHPLANKCSLVLGNYNYMPEDIDYEFYIQKANDLIGSWKPIQRFDADIEKIFEEKVG